MVELSLPEHGLTAGPSVVSERMPDARSVSVGVWVAVGGRDEDLPQGLDLLTPLIFIQAGEIDLIQR